MHRKRPHIILFPHILFSAFALLLAATGCALVQSPRTVTLPTQTIAATPDFLAPSYFLVLAQSEATPTPFMPLPITGTPPPSATPPPTVTPIPTPSPTPWLHETFAPPSAPIYGIPAPFPLLSPEHHINFLLLGSDSRGGASFRTDVIMAAMVDPEENSVTLISFPRDLYVYIPGWTMNRINTAYLHGDLSGYPGGGSALIKDTIQYNFGLRMDHVALVDFNGFREIIDTAGGIDVPLVCPFKEWMLIDPSASIHDENNWELTTIGPGIVHMEGDMALWYARARMRSSDFDRGRRQQEVIRALFSAALEKSLVLDAPQLYDDVKNTVSTDISLQTILSLVPFGLRLDEANLRSYYIRSDLTWSWTTPGGASVLLPNAEKIYAMLLEALAPREAPVEQDQLLVSIWNWTEKKDWDALAAERLHYAGFETEIDKRDETHASKTVLYDYTADQNETMSRKLLALLGLSPDRLVQDPQPDSDYDYRLVIGSDYNPCFNPATP